MSVMTILGAWATPARGSQAVSQPEAGPAAIGTAPDTSAAAGAASAPLRIGAVSLERADIYTADEIAGSSGFLRLLRRTLNGLHARTRERVIRQELLFAPGDRYDPALLAETERNLRALGFLASVSVAAADTQPGGAVDVDVLTREAWALKTEVSYSRSSAGAQRWSVLLSDNNFAGQGVQLTLGAGQDEDRRYKLLGYSSRRVFGSRWQASLSFTDQSDGRSWTVQMQRPFYALADAWGLEAQAWDREIGLRWYVSNAGPLGRDPERDASLYASLPSRERALKVIGWRRVRGQSEGRLVRLGLGLEMRDLDYDLGATSFELSDGRWADFAGLAGGSRPLGRREAASTAPLLALETVGRRWVTAGYLLQYGPVEDVPLDPWLRLQAGWGRRAWGAGFDAVHGQVNAGDWSRLAGGLAMIAMTGKASLGDPGARQAWIDVNAGWMAEHGDGRLTRLFAEGAQGDRLGGDEAFLLGLNRGLRTLEFDGMAGDRLARWSVEEGLRLPVEVLGFYKLGAAVFYGGGLAHWRDEPRSLSDARHEAGLGVRLGSLRSARADVVRLDVAWALDGAAGPVFTAVTGGLF